MKITVFGGAFISEDEINVFIDADYKLPAKHADIISLIYNDKPDVIILFHGVVISDLAVWHSELLEALNLGVRIYGTGGLGAIRAVELASFGMIGIGEVFRQYNEGEIEEDDEVFFKYEIKGGKSIRLTEPVVNLRATFKPAISKNIISEKNYTDIITIAKEIYYEDRTLDTIFSLAEEKGLDESIIEKLRIIAIDHYVDQQKLDAIQTLKLVKQLKESDLDNELPPRNEYDLFFDSLYDRDRKVKAKGTEIPLYGISNCLSLHHPEIEALNENVLNRQLASLLGDIMKIKPEQYDIKKEENRLRKKFGISDDEKFNEWLKESDFTKEDFFNLMEEKAKIRKVHAWFSLRLGFKKNTRCLLEELKLTNQYKDWKNKCADRQKLLNDCYDDVEKYYNNSNIRNLLLSYAKNNNIPWNIPAAEYIEEIIMSHSTFHLELAKEKAINDSIYSIAKKMVKNE